MPEVSDLAIYISGGTAIAVVGYAIKLTWQATRVEKSMRDDFQRGYPGLSRKREREATPTEMSSVKLALPFARKSTMLKCFPATTS